MEDIKENMERLIDKQRIELNALNLKDIKELKAKVDEIEARVTGQQPGSVSASDAAGEPQSEHHGLGGNVQELEDIIGGLRTALETTELNHGFAIKDMGVALKNLKKD